jgi:hypothetical protein
MLSINGYVMILVRPVHSIMSVDTILQTSHHWIFFRGGHLKSMVYDNWPWNIDALQDSICVGCPIVTLVTAMIVL